MNGGIFGGSLGRKLGGNWGGKVFFLYFKWSDKRMLIYNVKYEFCLEI